MRTSRGLLRFAANALQASSAPECSSSVQSVTQLVRIAAADSASSPACPSAVSLSALQQRGLASAELREAESDDYLVDGQGDQRADFEFDYSTEHAPVSERPRRVQDYEQLIGVLSRRRRAYKIRDVFEEMDLNGVAPGAMTYFRAMFASMNARRLSDTLYYWERMQRAGIQPDARAYGVVISASGRASQTGYAVKMMDEMRRKGLTPTKNTYLAALNAFAESAYIDDAWKIIEEMKEQGIDVDEFAYTAIINAYKHAKPAPVDVEARIDALLEKVRQAAAMGFSRRKEQGVGIVAYNAALNTFCDLGFHERVLAMFNSMEEEGLTPDYDSFSAVIRTFLKEALRTYRQFAASHPGSRFHLDLLRSGGSSTASPSSDISHSLLSDDDEEGGADGEGFDGGVEKRTSASASQGYEPPRMLNSASATEFAPDSEEIAPEYAHLQPHLARHLTRLKARVNLEAWEKVIEVYDEAARRGITLSPGVYYDLMRTAVLVSNTGHTEALGFAEHCLQEMTNLGMFLNSQNGSTILAACSRRELPAGLPFAHRLWDVLVLNGRVPKTMAINTYLRALQQREPQWIQRIEEVKKVAKIDPGRLRHKPATPQKQREELVRRRWVWEMNKKKIDRAQAQQQQVDAAR